MIEYAVIRSGYNVSTDVDLTKRVIEAIFVPTLLASGTLGVQGNHDTVSAAFYRLLDTRQPGSLDLQFAVGIGSRYINWPSNFPQPAFARFEMITAAGSFQHDNRTLTLVTRPR